MCINGFFGDFGRSTSKNLRGAQVAKQIMATLSGRQARLGADVYSAFYVLMGLLWLKYSSNSKIEKTLKRSRGRVLHLGYIFSSRRQLPTADFLLEPNYRHREPRANFSGPHATR